jgi:hypothetical protein
LPDGHSRSGRRRHFLFSDPRPQQPQTLAIRKGYCVWQGWLDCICAM